MRPERHLLCQAFGDRVDLHAIHQVEIIKHEDCFRL
jgi:hypothetical protein